MEDNQVIMIKTDDEKKQRKSLLQEKEETRHAHWKLLHKVSAMFPCFALLDAAHLPSPFF